MDYHKQQDLIFQEMQEKERLVSQAETTEYLKSLESRATRYRVWPKVLRILHKALEAGSLDDGVRDVERLLAELEGRDGFTSST